MFWKKKSPEEKAKGEKKKREEVKKIEGGLWGYMVKQQGIVVDVLQNLRRVEYEAEVGGKPVVMVRIFNPATADEKGIDVKDYKSLDSQPDLVLYEGYYQQVRNQPADINIEKK